MGFKVIGAHAWAFDTDFDPAKHILLIPDEVDSPEALQTFIGELARTPLTPIHPLWTIHVRPVFGPEAISVVVFRFHQAMSDGISLVKILCRSITDKTQDIYHIKSRFGGLSLSINTFRSLLMASIFLLTNVLLPPRPDWRRRESPFFDARSSDELKNVAAPAARKMEFFWSESVPLRVVDRISLVTRNSLNNVLLTCLAGALRTCLMAQGIRRMPAVRATVPVDLRKPLNSVTSSVQMGEETLEGLKSNHCR